MRPIQWLALGTVVLSISCHAFEASRGVGFGLALVAGTLLWIGQRGHARAGGTGTGTGTGDASTGSSIRPREID